MDWLDMQGFLPGPLLPPGFSSELKRLWEKSIVFSCARIRMEAFCSLP